MDPTRPRRAKLMFDISATGGLSCVNIFGNAIIVKNSIHIIKIINIMNNINGAISELFKNPSG